MGKRFAERNQLDLSQVNKDVLKEWDENDVFAKSVTEREGYPSFVFYEGPPSANGMPGIHHVMARTIKDIFCRYKTMSWMGHTRIAGRIRCGKVFGYYKRRYWKKNICSRIQCDLPQRRDEIH